MNLCTPVMLTYRRIKRRRVRFYYTNLSACAETSVLLLLTQYIKSVLKIHIFLGANMKILNNLTQRHHDDHHVLVTFSSSLFNETASIPHKLSLVVRVCVFCPGRPTFWLGKDTLRVSAKLFAENRRRLCRGLGAAGAPGGAVVLLQGGEQARRYCTDTDQLFRQVGHSTPGLCYPHGGWVGGGVPHLDWSL